MRKIVLYAATVALLISTALCVSAQRRQVILDRVVAVVGGSSILHSELTEYAEALVAQRRQMGYTSDRDPMHEALEALLEQKLLYNQAILDSVEISNNEVNSRIEAYLSSLSRRLVVSRHLRLVSICLFLPTARCCARVMRSRPMHRQCRLP
jgi:peptidyl-prolyl cis-trans isomerase SurA